MASSLADISRKIDEHQQVYQGQIDAETERLKPKGGNVADMIGKTVLSGLLAYVTGGLAATVPGLAAGEGIGAVGAALAPTTENVLTAALAGAQGASADTPEAAGLYGVQSGLEPTKQAMKLSASQKLLNSLMGGGKTANTGTSTLPIPQNFGVTPKTEGRGMGSVGFNIAAPSKLQASTTASAIAAPSSDYRRKFSMDEKGNITQSYEQPSLVEEMLKKKEADALLTAAQKLQIEKDKLNKPKKGTTAKPEYITYDGNPPAGVPLAAGQTWMALGNKGKDKNGNPGTSWKIVKGSATPTIVLPGADGTTDTVAPVRVKVRAPDGTIGTMDESELKNYPNYKRI